MPIIDSNISMLLSANAGSSGGAMSGSTVASGVMNNVIPSVLNADRLAGIEIDRKVFFKNNNGSDAALLPSIYCPVLPINATISLGLGVDSVDDADPLQGNMTNLAAPAHVAAVSDGADVRSLTIYGLDNSGSPAPISETLVLAGLTEQITAATFSKVWGAFTSSIDTGRTVTIKQGSGGATRGVIGPSKKMCWLWVVAPSAAGSGIVLPNLIAGGSYGVWIRLVVAAGAGSVRPDTTTVVLEETA